MSTIDKITHFYNFNTDFTDAVGSIDGTPNGAVINTSTPLVGAGSADLDGLNDDIDFGIGTALLSSGARSLSIWFKQKSEQDQYLFSCDNPRATAWIGNSVNRIYFHGAPSLAGWIPFNYNTDKHHIVFTDNGSSTYTIYLDNVLIGYTSEATTVSQVNFIVGSGITAVYLDALVDALAIADSVFDAADVSFLWNGGTGWETGEELVALISRSRLVNLGGTFGGITKSTLNNLGGI